MKRSTRLLLCLCLGSLLLVACTAAEYDDDEGEEELPEDDDWKPEVIEAYDDSDVVVLTEDNYEEQLKGKEWALVLYLKQKDEVFKESRIMPAFARAATQLKAMFPNLMVGKVNTTEEEDLAGELELNMKLLPTVKLFRNGEEVVVEYGPRPTNEIVRQASKRVGSATVPVNDIPSLEAIQQEEKILLLGYFDKQEGPEYESFVEASLKTNEVAFLITSNPAVAASMGLKSAPSFAIGRNYDGFEYASVPSPRHPSFQGTKKTLAQKLLGFIDFELLPPYLAYETRNFRNIFDNHVKKQVVVVATEEDLAPNSELIHDIIEAAEAYRGKVLFVVSPFTGEHGSNLVQFFELEEPEDEEEPAQVAGFDVREQRKLKFDYEEVNALSLKQFANEVLTGRVEKIFKSAAIPTKPVENGVSIVVGKTFDKIVKDPTKDVLLLLHGPWCEVCTHMDAAYSFLASELSEVESIVIAKLDYEENEHAEIPAGLDHDDFPILYFFPAGEDSKKVLYKGKLSARAWLEFLKENAKIPFEAGALKEEAEVDADVIVVDAAEEAAAAAGSKEGEAVAPAPAPAAAGHEEL